MNIIKKVRCDKIGQDRWADCSQFWFGIDNKGNLYCKVLFIYFSSKREEDYSWVRYGNEFKYNELTINEMRFIVKEFGDLLIFI